MTFDPISYNKLNKLEKSVQDLMTEYNTTDSSDLSQNGYTTLPNGLTMQWGVVSTTINESNEVTITFPKAFSSACFIVIPTIKYDSANDGVFNLYVQSTSTTEAVFQSDNNTTASIDCDVQFFVSGAKRAEKMISGCSKETTNNKMELQALIEAFKVLKKDKVKNHKIEIYLDSQYVLKSLTEWRESWEYRNFRGVKNQEQIKELFYLYDIYNKNNTITCSWVKGHSGHPENDKVDKEANNKAKNC